jgi:hypothetical protein
MKENRLLVLKTVDKSAAPQDNGQQNPCSIQEDIKWSSVASVQPW